jgi:MurNAc alpha-1-phosphate uridylyltransferase
MKAMILAAGRGERMRPLTDHLPKPLLEVGGKPLIEHHVASLARAGFNELIINVSHLSEKIMDYLGDGSRWQCAIEYSPEEAPLETAGGIIKALPLLGDAPFALVNGDVWSDYPLSQLRHALTEGLLAHMVLVDNPPQHHRGDFVLGGDGRLSLRSERGTDTLTYAGIAVFHPQLFAGVGQGKQPLLPLLEAAMVGRRISGEYYGGDWVDVGTPQRLAQLDQRLAAAHDTGPA